MKTRAEFFLTAFRQRQWLLPVLLSLLLLAQLLLSVQQNSQHADESTHLYSGYRILKCGDYAYGREHPPLSKMLAAFPLVLQNVPVDCAAAPVGSEEADEAVVWLYGQPNWWKLLTAARAAASLSCVLLLIATWLAARVCFGEREAALAAAFLVFEPNILAHGALVLTDTLTSALFVLTVLAVYRWCVKQTPWYLAASGVLFGLALLSKNSSPGLVFILAAIAAIVPFVSPEVPPEKRAPRLGRNLAALVPILLLAAVVVWAGYGFQGSSRHQRRASDVSTEAQAAPGSTLPLSVRALTGIRALHLLPQPYLDGLIDAHNVVAGEVGGVDILGKHYLRPPRFAMPLTISVKLTLGFFGILSLGAVGLALCGRKGLAATAVMLLPVLCYLLLSLLVKREVGIRYLLPVLPFAVILGSAGAVVLTRRYRWAQAVVIILLVAHAASSLRCYPNYLSYANEAWGGPQNLYRIAAPDIGQAYWQVSEYLKSNPNVPCWIQAETFIPPDAYGIRCARFGLLTVQNIPDRMNGIVVLSSLNFAHLTKHGEWLAGFQNAQPVAKLGGSAMLVFRGSFDTRSVEARGDDGIAMVLGRRGQFPEALAFAEKAAELEPDSAFTHMFLGGVLMENGQPEPAMEECIKARAIIRSDPNQADVEPLTDDVLRLLSSKFGMPLPEGVTSEAPQS